MSEAYTEQDLREAQNFIDCRLRDKTAMHAWIKSLAAEFSRIRSEARAGMREACAKFGDQGGCNCDYPETQGKHGHASYCPLGVAAAIRAISDLAADEAIERIKREARLSLTADLAAMVNYRYLLRDVTERLLRYVETVYPRCPEDSKRELEAAEERKALIADAKTILYETGIAALSGKET